jgi:hypothetical protein
MKNARTNRTCATREKCSKKEKRKKQNAHSFIRAFRVPATAVVAAACS